MEKRSHELFIITVFTMSLMALPLSVSAETITAFIGSATKPAMEEINKSCECPICTHKMSLLFSVPCDYRRPINSRRYDVYWCEKCNYGQIWGRPSKAEISRFYELDNYYTHNITEIYNHRKKGLFLDRVRTHISWCLDSGEGLATYDVRSLLKNDSSTICEIGCGNGKNLLEFLNKGFSPHTIRHSSATHLLKSWKLNEVSAYLGHSKASITADYYIHTSMDQDAMLERAKESIS